MARSSGDAELAFAVSHPCSTLDKVAGYPVVADTSTVPDFRTTRF